MDYNGNENVPLTASPEVTVKKAVSQVWILGVALRNGAPVVDCGAGPRQKRVKFSGHAQKLPAEVVQKDVLARL